MTERRMDEGTEEEVSRDSESTERNTEDVQVETEAPEPHDTDENTQRDAAPSEPAPLLAAQEGDDFRSRWEAIQTGFVDEPREAVEQANALVESLAKQLTDSFSERRSQLEEQWDRGDEVSTEDLRIALQRYRSFFDRLLRA